MKEVYNNLLNNKIVQISLFITISIVSIWLLWQTVENIFNLQYTSKLKGIFAVIYVIFDFLGNFVGGIYNAVVLVAFITWIYFLWSLKQWLFNKNSNVDPLAVGGVIISVFLFSVWGEKFLFKKSKDKLFPKFTNKYFNQ